VAEALLRSAGSGIRITRILWEGGKSRAADTPRVRLLETIYSNTMKIDIASSQDVDDLLPLLQSQFNEHEIEFEVDQLKAALYHLITHGDLGFAIIAKESNDSIGFAVVSIAWTLEHGGKSAWLDELFVLPDYRRRGIGTLLVERVLEEVKKLGCQALDLEVDTGHRRAESLYERMGFRKLDHSRWVKGISKSHAT
jgi:GNAT superfamily N-acetyltransferase